MLTKYKALTSSLRTYCSSANVIKSNIDVHSPNFKVSTI